MNIIIFEDLFEDLKEWFTEVRNGKYQNHQEYVKNNIKVTKYKTVNGSGNQKYVVRYSAGEVKYSAGEVGEEDIANIEGVLVGQGSILYIRYNTSEKDHFWKREFIDLKSNEEQIESKLQEIVENIIKIHRNRNR